MFLSFTCIIGKKVSGLLAIFSIRDLISCSHWRDDANGPMQVVSGAIGRERVHFEAPAAKHLSNEIYLVFQWFTSKNRVSSVSANSGLRKAPARLNSSAVLTTARKRCSTS